MKYSGCFVMNTCAGGGRNPRFINMKQYRYFKKNAWKDQVYFNDVSQATTKEEYCNITQLIDDRRSYHVEVSTIKRDKTFKLTAVLKESYSILLF